MKLEIVQVYLMFLSLSKEIFSFSENDFPDLDYLDTSVDPCDDFYQFTCGNFQNIHPRPWDQDEISIWSLQENELLETLNKILASSVQIRDPEALKKAKWAYKACVDVASADKFQAPERTLIDEFGGMELIDDIRSINFTWNDIARVVARSGIHQMFQFFFINSDPESYFIVLASDTWEQLGGRNRLYESCGKASIKANAFDNLLKNIAENIIEVRNPDKLNNEDVILKELGEITSFMSSLLNGGIIDDNILPLDTFITLQQLQNWTDLQFMGSVDINWVDYLNIIFKNSGITLNNNTFIVLESAEVLYGILNLVRLTDPYVVKNFALLRTFLYLAPDSDKPTREAFEDYQIAIGEKYFERWQYCTKKISDLDGTGIGLSFAVDYEYEVNHFDGTKINKSREIVSNLKDAFKSILATSDWVDLESRDALDQKVDNLEASIGSPDFIYNSTLLDIFYERLQVDDHHSYENSLRIRAFKQAYRLTELTDHNLWRKPPLLVNGYAVIRKNKIVVPIGLLQYRFVSSHNPVLDYSRLGTIMASAMTANFNTQGVQYDPNGRTSGLWFSNDTYEAFLDRIHCFEEQYSNYYIPEIHKYIDGVRTVDRHFGDNGGIRKSFLAYQKLVQEKKIQNFSQNYTLEQLFFIGLGTMWCSDMSIDYLNYLVAQTPYSPSFIRVIGSLSNMKEFSETFNCPVGSNMNPAKKCLAW